MLNELASQLKKHFTLKVEPLQYYLGIKLIRDRENKIIKLSQQRYIDELIDRFKMSNCNDRYCATPMETHLKLNKSMCPSTEDEKRDMINKPYKELIGSLMYTMVSTRPDIAHAVYSLSRFMANPGEQHWKAAKRVLRYLKRTKTHQLQLGNLNSKTLLEAYSDSDFGNDIDNGKSVTGYVVFFQGNLITWRSKQQDCVSLSSCESEYYALSSTCQEVLGIRQLMTDFGYSMIDPTTIYVDNQSAIAISKNPIISDRTRHINVRKHFIREKIENNIISLEYIPTNLNLADMFTKSLGTKLFTSHRSKLNMIDPTL